MMILFVISCSIHATAQTDYYYGHYNSDEKTPLTLNENKVCANISKDNKTASEKILTNAKILERTSDETFDIFILLRSELEKLTSLDSWKEYAKSVIFTSSYFYENKEAFASPYIKVKLKNEEDINLLTSCAEKYKLRLVGNSPLRPLWYTLALTPDSERSPLECANELYESGFFVASAPDLYTNNLICSNDPMFNHQWGLYNNYYPDIDISVSSAWTCATGKNIKIAILDDGVVRNHIDLASNIGSLYYDALYNSTSDYRVYGDHGTHCAGIAAAVKDNGKLIAGVAPDVTIVPISNKLDWFPQYSSKWADGITWAYEHGVDILSCSWHAFANPDIENAIQDAFTYGRYGKGCVVVFAAGNIENENDSSSVKYPANCNEKILVVGSIDSTGWKAPDSCYGTELDLVAPGVNILSTLPYDTVGYKSGTSMACPHVAGVAALILERNSELTVDQVNGIICSNAKKVPNLNEYTETKSYGLWSDKYGYGLVDAYSSVIDTPSNAYIQNDTITGTRIISAQRIYVGRDVTNTKDYGDVILGPSDITLKANYVEIKNSTTVPLGTTLTIEK